MRILQKPTLQAAVISIASLILASIVLLMLRVVPLAGQSVALMLSVFLALLTLTTLVARRFGQGHIAMGVYLLVIGGATIVLPRLLMPYYGQNDPDLLFFFLGPLYSIVGGVMVVISMVSHRHWMESTRIMLVRTLLLASPGVLLTLLWPVAFWPRIWDVPPYGLDLVAFSWIVLIGIFFAGSRFVKKVEPHNAQQE